MNLATWANRSVSDIRLDTVECVPPQITHSVWTNVRIEVRRERASLSGVKFQDCTWSDSYLGNAKLDLSATTFEGCILRGVTFMFARLQSAIFRNCELRDCHLRTADLRDVLFDHSRLISVNLEAANLHGAEFRDTELVDMEQWGWHGYQGAALPDAQRFKYFITPDPAVRLRDAFVANALPVPRERVEPFIAALERSEMGRGDVMLAYEEWARDIEFEDFIEVARFLVGTRA